MMDNKGASRVIALSGFRKSGKTQLAKQIVDRASEYGLEVRILSFANPLKIAFCRHVGINTEYFEIHKELYRVDIQTFSNETKKLHKNQAYFTDLLVKEIQPHGLYVIDDMRLLDLELLPLFESGAACWRVHADRDTRIRRGMIPNKEADSSPYESELDLPQDIFRENWGTGYIINNSDSISDLYVEADILIRRHYLKLLNKSL